MLSSYQKLLACTWVRKESNYGRGLGNSGGGLGVAGTVIRFVAGRGGSTTELPTFYFKQKHSRPTGWKKNELAEADFPATRQE